MWILEWLFGEPVTIEWITVTLPLTATGAKVLLASAGLALGAGLVWLMLNAPDRGDKRRDLLTDWLTALGWVLLPVWFVLLGGTLWHLWLLFSGMDSFLDNVGFGMGAVVAAFLGGPFVIWGAVLKQQTVEFQKEGHITDRISKAVEQLGSEKTVKDAEGERTVRNIEVRIGGLLSLERIAQDSTRYDKGRDHVRVMEILCAYVRENAKAEEAKDSIRKKWEAAQGHFPPPSGEDFKTEHGLHEDADIEEYLSIEPLVRWAQSLDGPRADIAMALRIIGRRSKDQLLVEARWGDEAAESANWVFDTPCPELSDPPEGKRHPKGAIEDFIARLKAWKMRLSGYRGYVPDLRNTNLQKADLSALNLSGANLTGARLDGADLWRVQLKGAVLNKAALTGAQMGEARMEGARLQEARMEGASLEYAHISGAEMWRAGLEGASLGHALLNGATLEDACLEHATLFQARLVGANMMQARLQDANLGFARMDGADLGSAQMTDANLWNAHLYAADLENADLQGAHMESARLEGANLGSARLVKANLEKTSMVGARLSYAQLDGAYLEQAKISQIEDLTGVRLNGAAVKMQSLADCPISQDQVNSLFGDASVRLPDGISVPEHWPRWELPWGSQHSFLDEWRKWQDDPDNYTPPPPPE